MRSRKVTFDTAPVDAQHLRGCDVTLNAAPDNTDIPPPDVAGNLAADLHVAATIDAAANSSTDHNTRFGDHVALNNEPFGKDIQVTSGLSLLTTQRRRGRRFRNGSLFLSRNAFVSGIFRSFPFIAPPEAAHEATLLLGGCRL